MINEADNSQDTPRSSFWVTTLPVLLLLTLAVSYGTGEALHARLLAWGESTWEGYAGLRSEPVVPQCSLATSERAGTPTAAKAAPAAPAGTEKESDDFLDDLLGDDDETDVNAQAAAAAIQRCTEEHAAYQLAKSRRVGGLRVFLRIEAACARFMQWGIAYLRHILVLLLLLCAAVATARRTHIALRTPTCQRTHIVSQAGQLLANLALLGSSYFKWQIDRTSQLEVQNAALPVLWMLGFGVLSALNIRHLLRPPAELSDKPGSVPQGLLTIPLYAMMCALSGFYFYGVEQHPAGLSIYLQQVTEHAQLYMHVGLYVWAGMLLKRTSLPSLCFDVLRTWKLPAELFAFAVVAIAAVPTAYSGASGIFVIAAGAVIFQELRRAGARQKLALAATALSGSLGVVLSPCLLVVIIASLNKQVTTDELFSWGATVYALTAGLFLVAMLVLWRNREKTRKVNIEPAPNLNVDAASVDQPRFLPALRKLLPYLLVSLVVLGAYGGLLNMGLGEHTAPVMLPVLLCIFLTFESRQAKRLASPKAEKPPALLRAVSSATSETSEHIGALLTLMSLSICLGGVVVRGQWLAAVPESFGSVWLTMAVLLVVLVLIGMVMDPYGAVILVSAAVADIAYRNGIDPVHFWMVVLVAFELGYLTPPVALNHLLTRHVVGPLPLAFSESSRASIPVSERPSFYARHEEVVLPLIVMGTALLIVAFGPLL